MYCPRCSQPRVSDEVQYCSQCGLPLDAVAALLAAGGKLPVHDVEGGKLQHSAKHKGVRQGAAIIIIGLLLTPLFAILHEVLGTSEGLIPLSAIIFFWGGILRLAYALIFQAEASRGKQGIHSLDMAASPAQVNLTPRNAALPPSQSIRMPNIKRSADTAELESPLSVTEHTTRLLKDQPDKQSC